MNKKVKDLSEDLANRQGDDPLKAVVFGTQPKLVKQMSDQLSKKKLSVRPVIEEKSLITVLYEFDPDLVLLEMNGITKKPIEDIVKAVFVWTNMHARKVNEILNSPSARLWSKAKVVIYKSETEGEAINSLEPAVMDYDEILFKCQQAGPVIYIGLYSPWSFISKITPLLIVNES